MAKRRKIRDEADDIERVLLHEGYSATVHPYEAARLYLGLRLYDVPLKAGPSWPSLRGIATRLAVAGLTAEQVYERMPVQVGA